jgi:hypothetical protein
MQVELARRERAVGRKIQALARGIATLMEPGDFLHRIGVGLHAFEVDGVVYLAISYLEDDGDGFRYRYAVLYGGEAARRALRDAPQEPSESDEPGPGRRVSLATYADYDGFLYRLPKYLGDINHRLEVRVRETSDTDARVGEARGLIWGTKRPDGEGGRAQKPAAGDPRPDAGSA